MTYIDEPTEARIRRRFVQGRMDSREAYDFRRELEQSKELREEVDLFRSLQFVARHAGLIAANRQISESVKDLKLDPDYDFSGEFGGPLAGFRRKFMRFPVWLWLVGLAVVPAALWWNLQRPAAWPPAALSRIVQPYFQPFENVISTDSEALTPLSLGMKAHDAGNYPAAINHLTRHADNTDDDNARLYLGISLLLNGETGKAQPIFENLSWSAGVFSPTAKWYLALCHLSNGIVSDAREILSEISTHPVHGRDAASLLNELGRK